MSSQHGDTPTKLSAQSRGSPGRYSKLCTRDQNSHRWAWQSIPVLQLPSVHAGGVVGSVGNTTNQESSEAQARSLVARVERRVLQVKEDNGVEKALRAAEEILGQRRREAIGRWVNFERNFVKENRCQTAGAACCRRRKELEESQRAMERQEARRVTTIYARDARQRHLIATRATANRDMRKRKLARDRVFSELVYGRIFMRTGGVVRTWTAIIAHVNRVQFLQGAVERAARQHLLELNENRLAIVTRFMCRMILKRRRIKAVKILMGALSAFTNSNAIGRYARRVKWGTRHLQAVVRRRMACMSSHLILLNRQWDRMYPPISLQPAPTAVPLQPPSSSAAATVSQVAASASPDSSKRPARKKGGGGQGAQKKGKGRQKRQQTVASAGRKGDRGAGGGAGRSGKERASERSKESVPPDDNNSADPSQADQRRRPPLYVCGKAKHEEIFAWLERTRSKHGRDVINYERFTVYPCMVELLLQHERTTYRTRLAAIKHVTKLKASGRLSLVWTQEGYYAKMAHVLPPPPRMPRMFTPEEGDEMFDRAAARSTRPSTRAAAANILQEEGPAISAVEAPEAAGSIQGSAPSEAVLIEVEAGGAAAAKAAAAGEAAVKLVLGREGASAT